MVKPGLGCDDLHRDGVWMADRPFLTRCTGPKLRSLRIQELANQGAMVAQQHDKQNLVGTEDTVSVSLRASAAGATPSSSSAPFAWGMAGTAVAVSALGLAMHSSRTAKAGRAQQCEG